MSNMTECARSLTNPWRTPRPANSPAGSGCCGSTRLRLLSLIGAKGEAGAACEMVEPLGVSQPTVSHHLKVLRRAGLVVSEKRGRWVYYRTVPERLAALSRILRA